MKIRSSNHAKQQGSVMMVTLMTAGVIGVTLASYLLMTQNQNVSIFRSQTWNSCMPVTEAGLEDGLQLINRFAGTYKQISLWTNYATGDSWDQSGGLPGNVYHMRRYMDASQTTFYDVYVTNVPDNNFNNDGPWVTAVATVPWNFQYTVSSAAIVPMFATGGGPGSTLSLGRSVVIQTIKDPLFNVAMAASGGIDLKGNFRRGLLVAVSVPALIHSPALIMPLGFTPKTHRVARMF